MPRVLEDRHAVSYWQLYHMEVHLAMVGNQTHNCNGDTKIYLISPLKAPKYPFPMKESTSFV